MPHNWERYLAQILAKNLKWSPCIGILGMRQVGKSTLMQSFCKRHYSFDLESTIATFEKSAENILQDTSLLPIGLDEVQKFPAVFDTLKYYIDQKKIPGRFLVIGSVRFSSKKNIRESLTGRISQLELLPFTLAESYSRELSPFLSLLTKNDGKKIFEKLSNRNWAKPNHIQQYLETGGLPGICFKRDKITREKLFQAHLDTLLGRDIHFIHNTKLSISKLSELYSILCQNQGIPFSYLNISRKIGTTAPTIKKAVEAMEALFLIRKYGATYISEDMGLATYSMRFAAPSPRTDMFRFLHSELKAQANYFFPTGCRISPYQTRGGIDISFLIEFNNQIKTAITIESDEAPSDKSIKSLVWFKKKHPKTTGIVFHMGEKATILNNGILSLPWNWVA